MNSKLRWIVVAAVVLIAAVSLGMVIGRGSAKQTPAIVATEEAVSPAPSDNAKVVLARGDTAKAQGSYQQAQKLYEQALDKSPDTATSTKAQSQLGQANIQAIFSTQFSPSDLSYEVQSGDTLMLDGQAGAWTEGNVSPWDIAPVVVLFEEACASNLALP